MRIGARVLSQSGYQGGCLLGPPPFEGSGDDLGRVLQPQLLENAGATGAEGLDTDRQFCGDFGKGHWFLSYLTRMMNSATM